MSQQQDQQHMHGERRLAQLEPYKGPERRKSTQFEEPGGSTDKASPDASVHDNEDEQKRLMRIRQLES